jgi:hypothetical protein
MPVWKLVAAVGCTLTSAALGIFNIDFFAGLGGPAPYFRIGPVEATRSHVLAALALGIDTIMAVALFAVARWLGQRRWLPATMAALVWAVTSAIAGHSTYCWLRSNVGTATAPLTRGAEIHGSLKRDLADQQSELARLRAARTDLLGRAERNRHRDDIRLAVNRTEDLRGRLEKTPATVVARPIEGFELLLTIALWSLSALGWFALLGPTRVVEPPQETASRRSSHVAEIVPPSPAPEPGGPPPRPRKVMTDRGATTRRKVAASGGAIAATGRGGIVPPKASPGGDNVVPLRDDQRDSILAWLHSVGTASLHASMRASDAHARFIQFAANHGLPPPTRERFAREVRRLLPSDRVRRRNDGTHYLGLAAA